MIDSVFVDNLSRAVQQTLLARQVHCAADFSGAQQFAHFLQQTDKKSNKKRQKQHWYFIIVDSHANQQLSPKPLWQNEKYRWNPFPLIQCLRKTTLLKGWRGGKLCNYLSIKKPKIFIFLGTNCFMSYRQSWTLTGWKNDNILIQ